MHNNNRQLHLPPFTVVKVGELYAVQRGLVFAVEAGVSYEVERATTDLRYEQANDADLLELSENQFLFVHIETDNRDNLFVNQGANIGSATLKISSDDLGPSSNASNKYKQIARTEDGKLIQVISSDIYISTIGLAVLDESP